MVKISLIPKKRDKVMSDILFPTRLYRARIPVASGLEQTCLGLAMDDNAGRRWSKDHGYGGYTSYASLNDLTRRASIFAELERAISGHVAKFARELQFDLGGKKLGLDSLWVNVMDKGSVHTPHIHPHAAVSGTYYVTVPAKSGAIRFEPRRPASKRLALRTGCSWMSNRKPACCCYGKAGCAMAWKATAPRVSASPSALITQILAAKTAYARRPCRG
jgi:uncharacterized protein (TIGR02466 family)